MDDIYESFDYGYDPEVPEEAPLFAPPRPAELPGAATVNADWLPPVGHQNTPSCFAWASTYGLATFAAAQAGNYTPWEPQQQASPLYTYIEVLKGRGIASGTCVGGQIVSCFATLQANDGTPSMAAAPNQDGCAATWAAYGNADLPSDASFDVTAWKAIDITGPDGLDRLRAMIAAGVPLAYGTWLYTDFPKYDGSPNPYVGNGQWLYNKKTGNRAGHCMVIIGYDDSVGTGGAVLIQNSFGSGWGCQWNGNGGYIWMAYATLQATAQGRALFIESLGAG